MKTSVIITTYNGEKYIKEQLNSILNQTLRPDEVIISDDNSKDNTIDIIKSFIKKNSLNNWYLYENKTNKGWRKNFITSIFKTSGEIIFFSDQDDIWLKNKIEIMAKAMKKNNKIKYLSGKVLTIDKNGTIIETKFSKSKYTGNIKKSSESKVFYNYNNLGCTISVRRNLALKIADLDFFELGHDKQLSMLANIDNSSFIIDIPIIKYRIHDNNVTNVDGKNRLGRSSKSNRIKKLNSYINWINKIIEKNNEVFNLSMNKVKKFQDAKKVLNIRIDFLRKGDIYNLLKSLLYIKNYSLRNYLGDLYYFLKR
jgi:glycosyltransferase involved in cell wall biosynthesis